MSVSLVGAGCGTPRLLTSAAAACLSRADHVVYDRLIHPDILQLAPATCRFHPVGKREGNHSLPQEEINRLLADLAADGARVVRLKGGDPFVFGRGGEEAEFLERAGIPWMAIPGVTAALGGALCMGLPPTHRDAASSVTLATGHRRAARTAREDDAFWQEVADASGTVALYMGVSDFEAIASRLVSLGKSPDTPVSLISWGGWGRAARLDGTIETFCARAREKTLPAPAILYIGGAAPISLSPMRGPLAGLQVVLCRPYPECWETGRALEELGADCYGLPLLSLEPLEPADADEVRNAVCSADWLVLTSPRGPAELRRIAPDLRRLRGRVVSIGDGTSRALRAAGIVPEYTADGSSEGLARLLGEHVRQGERVVFARNERGSHVACEAARARGAVVRSVSTYRMVGRPVPGIEVMAEQWRVCGVDAMVFGSAALVEAYAEAMGSPPASAEVIAWGTVCAETAKRCFGREARKLDTPDMAGLVRALADCRRD